MSSFSERTVVPATSAVPKSATCENGSCTTVKSPRSIIIRSNAVDLLRGALHRTSRS
jgi:hypothetical protein